MILALEVSGAEAVGYLASALVVLSLTMTSVVRLRTISLAGSIAFVVYGAMLGAVPILISNAVIAAINVWFLRSELGMKRDLGASQIPSDSPFLTDFVHFHLDDIHRFQPDFRMPDEPCFALVLTRDGLPAGAFVGERRGDELEVVLDYVMRAYRDSRLGDWLFGRGAALFRQAGIGRLVTRPGNDAHREYLERMGFVPHDGSLVLDLTG